jgi:hypothetical protein
LVISNIVDKLDVERQKVWVFLKRGEFLSKKLVPLYLQNTTKENLMTDNELIHEILRIITLDGEDYSDGECLDEVWVLLTENGYNPDDLRRTQ